MKYFFLILAVCLLSVAAHATTYYIAAGGCTSSCSDSNNGTTKLTAWLHAPGMPATNGESGLPAAGDENATSKQLCCTE